MRLGRAHLSPAHLRGVRRQRRLEAPGRLVRVRVRARARAKVRVRVRVRVKVRVRVRVRAKVRVRVADRSGRSNPPST